MKLVEQLIEQEVRKILREASYTETDVPKHFWMVTSVDKYSEDFIKQLATGELKGVKGISDRKQIVTQWLGVARNAVLIIPSGPFLKQNKVSRVMYDNPHFLVSKGMQALFRLFNRTPEDDYDWNGTMQTLMDYVKAGSKEEQLSDNMKRIQYLIDYGELAPSWYGSEYRKEKPNINTIKDLSQWVQQATVEIAKRNSKYNVEEAEAITRQEWEPLLLKALKLIGKVYQDEGEWLVKGDTMKIPAQSTLFIAVDADPKKISDQAREEYADPEKRDDPWSSPRVKQEKETLALMDLARSFGLQNHYNLHFVPMKKFEKYREKLWAKRG